VFANATDSLRLPDQTPGRLWANMAATGHNHGLRIRVFGDEGSLEWRHEEPHHLTVEHPRRRGHRPGAGRGLAVGGRRPTTRIGRGHPEGFIEAFANFYRDVADELRAGRGGGPSTIRELSFPSGRDALIGVQFVEAVAASHQQDGAWVTSGAPQKEAGI
jgi:predicted dehydrogenase